MSIHQTHHIYNLALGKKFENIFFLENSPVQPLVHIDVLQWVAVKIGIKFKPRLFTLYLDRV